MPAMLYRFLWIFFIYAFLGWCTEVSYAALVTGKFVNRGFLNGPWCPVYGFGVVIVLGCLTPLSGHLPALFAGSVLLTSLLEWLTGFALEKLFHQQWWDYSDQPFNLSGYICLRFSIAWGFACVFVVRLLHPTVLALIHLIPRLAGIVLLGLLGAVMAVNESAYRCPRDISMLGFDNLLLSDLMEPRMYTVIQPMQEMAERAARLLLRRMEDGGAGCPETVVLSTRMSDGNSILDLRQDGQA